MVKYATDIVDYLIMREPTSPESHRIWVLPLFSSIIMTMASFLWLALISHVACILAVPVTKISSPPLNPLITCPLPQHSLTNIHPWTSDTAVTRNSSVSSIAAFRICRRITSFSFRRSLKTEKTYVVEKSPLFIPKDNPWPQPSIYPDTHKVYGLSFTSKTKPWLVTMEQTVSRTWPFELGRADAEKRDDIVWDRRLGRWKGTIVYKLSHGNEPVGLRAYFGPKFSSHPVRPISLDIDFEAEAYVFGGS